MAALSSPFILAGYKDIKHCRADSRDSKSWRAYLQIVDSYNQAIMQLLCCVVAYQASNQRLGLCAIVDAADKQAIG
jgi:hypothetical protein